MILGKIILDMFSARTRYIADFGKYIADFGKYIADFGKYIAKIMAIRYKKDGILTKSVFFDANNLGLFACNLNRL
jgi:hypothetical protein